MDNTISPTIYSCAHPTCKVSGPAEKMWNLKGKPRTILCGRHGHEARERGLRTYRLSDSLVYEQRLEAEAKESETFYQELRERQRKANRVTLGRAVGKATVKQMMRAATA